MQTRRPESIRAERRERMRAYNIPQITWAIRDAAEALELNTWDPNARLNYSDEITDLLAELNGRTVEV